MFSMVLSQLCWALVGCDRMSSVTGFGCGQGFIQALCGFSFCLADLHRCFNMGLLFIYSFPNSLQGSLTLSVLVFKVLLFVVQMMKVEAGGGG